MSQTPSPTTKADHSLEHPPPLTQCKLDGQRYVRRSEVTDEIRKVAAQDESNWDVPRLKSETLVYLIRSHQTLSISRAILSGIVHQIGRRVARVVGDYSKGINQSERQELIDQIGHSVITMTLTPSRSRKGEFLEVSFRGVVKGLALNALDQMMKHKRECQFVQFGEDHDGKTVEIQSPGPDPEEEISNAEITQLLERSLDAITNPLHREAVILHYRYAWPIYCGTDPDKPTLSKHFNKSERQIRTWLKGALHQMRTEIGDKL